MRRTPGDVCVLNISSRYRCVYVLPTDVHHVSERTVPFELDVEIVKDCSNFSREIADVFDVIKANCDDYSLVLKKVICPNTYPGH